VIGDVDPSLLVLVVALVLTEVLCRALRLSPRTSASWCRVIRVMVWGLPPGRAGRAPHASRHSKRAEVALGAGWCEVVSAGGGLAVRLPLVVDVAAGSGVEGGFEPVAGAETRCVLFEQKMIMDATPTGPAYTCRYANCSTNLPASKKPCCSTTTAARGDGPACSACSPT